jgi:uncharacterized protein (DUF2062 family)
MPRRLLKRLAARMQPAVDKLTSNPTLRRFVPALADPDLWHLNRRSTARAVAIGLFCGLIPGPLQAISALIVCLWLRSNLPLTVITTFYTNPLTIVPLYLVAYEYGRLLFPDARAVPPAFHPPADAGLAGYLPSLVDWMTALGKPLAAGLVLLAVTLAVLGWIAVRVGWRCHVVHSWRRRARQRRETA